MTHSVVFQSRATTTGTTSHQITFTSVAAHETLTVGFVDRTGGAVINSVTDGAGGTWTLRSSDSTSTFLNATYVREDAAAAASLTVTITTAASQNAQLVGARIATDAGGTTYPTYNNVATPVVLSDSTNSDANACALSAGGSLIGLLGTSTAQSVTPTVDAGDSIGPAAAAGARSFLVFDAQAAAGSYTLQTTLATSSASRWLVISFIDSTAAVTVTPGKADLTLNGRTPTTSAFQNVRIREVLVNGSGQAVASATDIGLRVWYSGICAGAPDVSLNGMTTDANGTTSWSIATGTLAFNQTIFYVAQNSVSYSHYACGRLIPNYE